MPTLRTVGLCALLFALLLGVGNCRSPQDSRDEMPGRVQNGGGW